VAAKLGIPRLNLHGTGLDSDGLPIKPVEMITGDLWLKAEHTLARIAELGQREGVVFCLENLNTAVDHPGTPFAKAADTLALVAAVDSRHLRLMLDIYHAQIGDGNLVELINKCAPSIGEVQVAEVPGRCEPWTGEINYPRIADALHDVVTKARSDWRPGLPVTANWRSSGSAPRSRLHGSPAGQLSGSAALKMGRCRLGGLRQAVPRRRPRGPRCGRA
jgi:sugar phosphate isomerase/epimerase